MASSFNLRTISLFLRGPYFAISQTGDYFSKISWSLFKSTCVISFHLLGSIYHHCILHDFIAACEDRCCQYFWTEISKHSITFGLLSNSKSTQFLFCHISTGVLIWSKCRFSEFFMHTMVSLFPSPTLVACWCRQVMAQTV